MKNGNILLGLGVLLGGYFLWKNKEINNNAPDTEKELDKKISDFTDYAETKQKSTDFINASSDFTIDEINPNPSFYNSVKSHYYKQGDKGYCEKKYSSPVAKMLPPKAYEVTDEEYIEAYKRFQEQQTTGTSKIVDIPVVAPIKTPTSIIKDIIYDNYNLIGATVNGEKYYKKDGKYYIDALQFGGAERFRPMEITEQEWINQVISKLPI